MDIPLKSDFPLWFIVLALLAGLAYASVLYVQNKRFRFGTALTTFLFALRTIAITVISFLLLSPMIRSIKTHFQKPAVVMAMDNSASMGMLSEDTAALKADWKMLEEKLSEKYVVNQVAFAEDMGNTKAFDFEGQATNYEAFLSTMSQQYQQTGTVAMVVASDGIYNRGVDPLYANIPAGMSLFTVGVGSDVSEPDVFIRQVRSNEVVYTGNEFPVEVHVRAEKAMGENTTLRLRNKGKTVATKTIEIDKERFTGKYTFYLEAQGEGMQHYTVTLTDIRKEKNIQNNQQDFYIEVVNEQSEVLILAHAPHPDVFTMKRAIDKRPQYKVTTALLDDFDEVLTDFDFVILHQLPDNKRRSADVLAEIFGKEIPVLFVLGTQTDIPFFNSANAGVDVQEFNKEVNQATPSVNEDFSLFRLSPAVSGLLQKCPPLTVPFGDYVVAPSENTMLYQQLDDLTTSMPLLTLSGNFQHKTAVLTGTGIWKWRIQDYLQNKSHHAFDDWFYGIVRYMAIRQDKDFFRVYAEQRYPGREAIVISAELYNASYELVNAPEVRMDLRNEDGEVFNYLFDREGDKYRLNFGQLPEGAYTYEATTRLAGKDFYETGSFVVARERLEAMRTVADFDLLKKLADRNNGFFVPDDQMLQVADSLLNAETSKPVKYTETSYNPVLDIYWILILILVLLSLEWFLRKYNGGY